MVLLVKGVIRCPLFRVFAVVLLLLQAASAQFRFDSWTTDDGLPQNGVRRIVQTPDGYLWFTTFDGLVRFDGAPAMAALRELQPTVAVLDVEMPGPDGLEVARIIKAEGLPTAIIILTMYKEERFFVAAMNVGVQGYVLKDSAAADIITAIKVVITGEEFISPTLSKHLIGRHQRVATLGEKNPSLQNLTQSERRVLALIAQGRSTREIAGALFVSPRTIDHHRANISEKLALKGPHALLRFAMTYRTEFE